MAEKTEWDYDKFKSMIVFIVSSVNDRDALPPIDRRGLSILCYLCDFNHYELYDRTISGATYVHLKSGPMPTRFCDAMDDLITDEKLCDMNGNINIVKTELKLNVCDNALNETETSTIRETIKDNIDLDTKNLMKKSKKDIPWMVSYEGQELNPDFTFYRTKYTRFDKNEQY